MTETQMVSCIRFSMQLLISQSIFTIGWKKRKNFPVWLAAGFAGVLAGSAADVLGTEADSSRESTGSYFLLFLPVLIQYFSDEMLFCSRV